MSDLGLGIIVSLKDAFTQNATRIQSSMQSLDTSVEAAGANMTHNLGFIERGTMMIGAGLALLTIPTGLVASTAATQKALGELASVGVKDFRAMEDAAESFTNTWAGTCKAEFITAGYDVRSALASLSDQAVGTSAAMAALTAKATKATVQEMVETFTTGYGNAQVTGWLENEAGEHVVESPFDHVIQRNLARQRESVPKCGCLGQARPRDSVRIIPCESRLHARRHAKTPPEVPTGPIRIESFSVLVVGRPNRVIAQHSIRTIRARSNAVQRAVPPRRGYGWSQAPT